MDKRARSRLLLVLVNVAALVMTVVMSSQHRYGYAVYFLVSAVVGQLLLSRL